MIRYQGEEIQPLVKSAKLEIYEDDIDLAIAEACEKFEIENLTKEGQTRWKAVMAYVGRRVFPDSKKLKEDGYINIDKYPLPLNRYDADILNILCDYYIRLSYRYNKLISSVAFAYFINIPYGTVEDWGQGKSSKKHFGIWKKLQGEREDTLKDKAVDSGNVMGVFQVGRREYQWDLPGVRQAAPPQALSAAELPKLGAGAPEGLPMSGTGEQIQ